MGLAFAQKISHFAGLCILVVQVWKKDFSAQGVN